MSEQFEPHAEMPPEPMLSEAETRRLVEQIEARIKETEQLERAIATRPQPSAEPVAWMYEREGCKPDVTASRQRRWVEGGSTEEALVRASALEAARLQALEEAAKVADNRASRAKAALKRCAAEFVEAFEAEEAVASSIAKAIRALKENPNAG